MLSAVDYTIEKKVRQLHPRPADRPRRASDSAPGHFRLANRRRYLLARGGRVIVRVPALPDVSQRVSLSFEAAFEAFRQAVRDGVGLDECPLVLDSAGALGRGRPNTSRVVRTPEGGVAGVIFLHRTRLPFDEYVVAHELIHLALYAGGLPKVERAPETKKDTDARLLSTVSTVTSHFLVHRRMREYGFDVGARERGRLRAFRAAVRGSGLPAAVTALTCAEFVHHLPAAAASLQRLVSGCGPETQRLYSIALQTISRADLAAAPSIENVQRARRLFFEMLGRAEEVRYVNPFEALQRLPVGDERCGP